MYFLSDRNGPVSLFSYDTRTRQVKEEVKNDGLDFKSIGAGADAIVIEQFGGLALFDLKTGQVKPVPVQIAGDLPEVRSRMVNVSSRLSGAHLSPNGARARLRGARRDPHGACGEGRRPQHHQLRRR